MARKKALIVEYRTSRDFGWLVIPGTNPTIGIPAYSETCAHVFASRITRGKDVAEDYLNIPITPDLRMRFRLPDPVTPPETLDGWHPFKQVSYAYWLRHKTTKAARIVKHPGGASYFLARPTYTTQTRTASTHAA